MVCYKPAEFHGKCALLNQTNTRRLTHSGCQICFSRIHTRIRTPKLASGVLLPLSQSAFDKEVRRRIEGTASAALQTEADAVRENTTNHCSRAYFCPDSVYLTIVARREKNRSPNKTLEQRCSLAAEPRRPSSRGRCPLVPFQIETFEIRHMGRSHFNRPRTPEDSSAVGLRPALLCSQSGLHAAPTCRLARHKHERLHRWGFLCGIVRGYFTLRVTRTNSNMPGQ